jgi:cell division protein FtsB
MSCARCERLAREVESLSTWIKNHQDRGLAYIDKIRAQRKEIEALKAENATLRTGIVRRKSRKRTLIGEGSN